MARRTLQAITVAGALVAAALAGTGQASGEEFSPPERDRILRRAQVWLPPSLPVTELGRNPRGDDGFADTATVDCRFQPSGVGGRTPKFECQLADGDEVKVKHGRSNPEIFSEVMASLLLARLGFPTDRMYTVERERPVEGRRIETAGDRGRSWEELTNIDPAAGGATRAQVDAQPAL